MGIVVHQGTTESGHYYSYIKERGSQNNWFEFNDKEVSKFDPSLIPQECFGGEDPELAFKKQYDESFRLKNRNAYILIYERKEFIDQTRFHEFVDD